MINMVVNRFGFGSIATALALGLVGAGCGGGETADLVVVPKAEYTRKADAACQLAYNRIRKDYEAFTKGKEKPFSTSAEVDKYAETVIVPIRKRQLEEMRELGAPKGEEERAEAILAAYEDGIQRAEEDPEEAVSSLYGVFQEAEQLTSEYGLRNCR